MLMYLLVLFLQENGAARFDEKEYKYYIENVSCCGNTLSHNTVCVHSCQDNQ